MFNTIKQFLKPSKKKFFVFSIFFLILPIIYFIHDYSISKILYLLLYTPVALLTFLLQSLCGWILRGTFCTETIPLLLSLIIVGMAYFYLLACIIVYIWNKTKENKKFKRILLITILIFVSLLIIAYFVNFFDFLGVCRPGTKTYNTNSFDLFFGKSCYTPSGQDGQPCVKKTDCGTANCALSANQVSLIDGVLLVNEKEIGVCRESIYCYRYTLDEEGNVKENVCFII